MSADRGPRPQPPTMLTCPTCGTRFHLTKTPTPPFCCQRCQLIDLGRWFNEDIGLPYEGNPGDTPVENRDDDDSDYE